MSFDTKAADVMIETISAQALLRTLCNGETIVHATAKVVQATLAACVNVTATACAPDNEAVTAELLTALTADICSQFGGTVCDGIKEACHNEA